MHLSLEAGCNRCTENEMLHLMRAILADAFARPCMFIALEYCGRVLVNSLEPELQAVLGGTANISPSS